MKVTRPLTRFVLAAGVLALAAPSGALAGTSRSGSAAAARRSEAAVRRPQARGRPSVAFASRNRKAAESPASPLRSLSDDEVSVAELPPTSPSSATVTTTPLLTLALAGAVAAFAGDAILHPIDCIKTLQQSDEGYGLSMAGAAGKILQNYGPGGFFRGMWTYASTDAGGCALKMAAYERLKKIVNRKVPERYLGPALFLCAALSFLAMSVVSVPGELLKQRMQTGLISSVPGGVASILQSDGPLGLYRGFSGVCLRDVPYTMLELGLYDNLKRLYLGFKICEKEEVMEGGDRVSAGEDVAVAALTGGITGFLTTPLDTIKTKLMVDSDLYAGFFDCLHKTVEEHGVGAAFHGAVARVLWILPFTALYLPLYEVLKRRFASSASEKEQ